MKGYDLSKCTFFVYILQHILYIPIYTTQIKLKTQHYESYSFSQKTNK